MWQDGLDLENVHGPRTLLSHNLGIRCVCNLTHGGKPRIIAVGGKHSEVNTQTKQAPAPKGRRILKPNPGQGPKAKCHMLPAQCQVLVPTLPAATSPLTFLNTLSLSPKHPTLIIRLLIWR